MPILLLLVKLLQLILVMIIIEDAQDLDIVMPLYNLLYYSKILEKRQDLFGIIIQIFQNLDMIKMQI